MTYIQDTLKELQALSVLYSEQYITEIQYRDIRTSMVSRLLDNIVGILRKSA